jgi:hypothetical protein
MKIIRGDNFSPRLPCQWYVRGGGDMDVVFTIDQG